MPEKLDQITTEKRHMEEYTLEEENEDEKRHELEKITLNPNRHKPLKNPPKYTRTQKKIISYILSFMATVEAPKFRNQHIPRIYIRSHNFDALKKFQQMIRLGKIGNPRIRRHKTTKQWQIINKHEIIHLLEQITLRGRRERQLAKLMLKFCKTQDPKTAEQIQRLNNKPRLKQYQISNLYLEQELEERRLMQTQHQF